MIIGINGYIGSGKDLVGSIIMFLTGNYREDGKLITFERYMEFSQERRDELSSWQVRKFAQKLKQIASILTGIPIEKFENQEFKKTYLGPEWNWSGAISSDVPITVREFLQRLGTEAIRDNIHPDAWVNALFTDYKGKKDYEGLDFPTDDSPIKIIYPNWIITDVRFPNEAQAIKNRAGIVIRVNRDWPANDELNKLHLSETSLDDWEFDWVIENNGSIEELIERVKEMLIYFKLL